MEVLANPAILFFMFGIAAGLMRSSLEIPAQISKFLSLYLLMSIGIKGGAALASSGLTTSVLSVVTIDVSLAFTVPLLSFFFLRRYLNVFDAAAVSATYGSISAVTFVTANQFLSSLGVAFDSYMSAVMALMESPAIIIAVVLVNRMQSSNNVSIPHLLRESFTEGANLLLLASLAIGFIVGPAGYAMMAPFTAELFTGLLAFFLLDMGIQVAKNIPQVKGKSPVLILYAIAAPVLHSMVALALCIAFAVPLGNTVLMMVLAASASYIAVPAALKHAIPDASPSIYLALSLGITFPFNVLIGIPLYFELASLFV